MSNETIKSKPTQLVQRPKTLVQKIKSSSGVAHPSNPKSPATRSRLTKLGIKLKSDKKGSDE